MNVLLMGLMGYPIGHFVDRIAPHRTEQEVESDDYTTESDGMDDSSSSSDGSDSELPPIAGAGTPYKGLPCTIDWEPIYIPSPGGSRKRKRRDDEGEGLTGPATSCIVPYTPHMSWGDVFRRLHVALRLDPATNRLTLCTPRAVRIDDLPCGLECRRKGIGA